MKVEGLFRKSGSLGRQKVLRGILENEGTCHNCEFAQAHDVAALVKSFFRELPDPLLTNRLTPAFIKSVSLNNKDESISSIVLCCLLLPDEHLRVLIYFCDFITKLANHSIQSKMTLTNLAIVFAPNLMAVSGKDRNSEKAMREATLVLDLLFKNAHLIGMVPDPLFNKALRLNAEGGFCSSSGDELDDDRIDQQRGRTMSKSSKQRDRSRSIKGFIKRNFKNQNENSPKYVRSMSQKSASKNSCLKKQGLTENVNIHGNNDFQSVLLSDDARPVKRRNNFKSNCSPVRKSPRLAKKVEISSPKLASRPHQMVLSPRHCLIPIQTQKGIADKNDGARSVMCSALPSKFEFTSSKPKNSPEKKQVLSSKLKVSRSKSNVQTNRQPASDSGMSPSQHHHHHHHGGRVLPHPPLPIIADENKILPQPKLSRSTQKPHVRVSRRASSLEKRRAKYASEKTRRHLPTTPDDMINQDSIEGIIGVGNIALAMSETLDDLSDASNTPTGDGVFLDDHSPLLPGTRCTSIERLREVNRKWSVSPDPRTMRRSVSSGNQKQSTPYALTPHVTNRRPNMGFI